MGSWQISTLKILTLTNWYFFKRILSAVLFALAVPTSANTIRKNSRLIVICPPGLLIDITDEKGFASALHLFAGSRNSFRSNLRL